uniref:Neurotensin receptor 1 n=1 Tax=Anas platyrhynchos platyrhynchos TaxID=8840 RepID=U3I6I7_ANAPP
MHPNGSTPGGTPGPQPSAFTNTSNRSDPLLPKGPDEEDLDVNTDIYSKVMVTVIYLVLFLVGTVGNSITAYTLVRKKSLQNLQSTVHYHLASLAFSDLLIFLLCMPIELYNFIWVHHPWAFGGAVCKGYYFLRDACTYATALNIASLSVERYMAICHPFKAKSIMSRSRTKKFISCIWIASFLLAIPMIFTMGQIYVKDHDPDSLICTTILDAPTLKMVIQVRSQADGDPEWLGSGSCLLSWALRAQICQSQEGNGDLGWGELHVSPSFPPLSWRLYFSCTCSAAFASGSPVCLTQILYSLRRREPSDLRTMWLKCIISTHLPFRIRLLLCVNMIGLKRADYFLATSSEITV